MPTNTLMPKTVGQKWDCRKSPGQSEELAGRQEWP